MTSEEWVQKVIDRVPDYNNYVPIGLVNQIL